MSNFPYSVSLAVPAADRDDGNALAVALGWDQAPGSTFAVPLSADGTAPATHFGCHAWAGPEFIATLSGAQGGSLPDIAWADFGLTAERVGELMTGMLSRVQTGSVGFQTLISGHNLQVVTA